MKTIMAALVAGATLILSAQLPTETANAAYMTTSTTYRPGDVVRSRTIHGRYGSRTVRVSRGPHGRVCRTVVRSGHGFRGGYRAVRQVCN